MDELKEIKQRKMEELKNSQLKQMQQQNQEEAEMKQQITQLEMVVKQALTKEALQRYGNLKTGYPDKAVQLLVILAQAIQSGQATKIDDNMLKEVLKKITPEKKEIKIKRV